jgi:hypothetical protein
MFALSKLVSTRRLTVLSLPLQKGLPGISISISVLSVSNEEKQFYDIDTRTSGRTLREILSGCIGNHVQPKRIRLHYSVDGTT